MLQLTIVKNDDSVIYYVHIIMWCLLLCGAELLLCGVVIVWCGYCVYNYVVLSSLRTSELNPSLNQKGYLLR